MQEKNIQVAIAEDDPKFLKGIVAQNPDAALIDFGLSDISERGLSKSISSGAAGYIVSAGSFDRI